MAGEETKKEVAPATKVEAPLETQKAPEIAKPQTGAELTKLREEIETKRKAKKERQDFLKKEAGGRRTTETWVAQKMEEGLTAGIAKDTISSTVDEKLEKYIPQFTENGIGDATNFGVVKQAAKDLIYEHYCKTGNSKEVTTSYVDSVLTDKLSFLFEGLKKIHKNDKYGFKKPIDCLTAFSDFAGLKIIGGGILQLNSFRDALKLQKQDYEFFLKTFEEFLIIGGELTTLNTESANIDAKADSSIDVSKMFAAGTLVLKEKTRITLIQPLDANEKLFIDAVTKNLPDNLDPKLKEAALKWIGAEFQKLNPSKVGDTFEIAENGTVTKVDLAAEQQAAEQQAADAAKASAEQQVAATEGSAENDNPFKTGFAPLDKILEPLLKVFDKFLIGLAPMLAGLGLSEWVEFMGLSEAETLKAREFKETCKKMELKLETLRPLFFSGTEMRKILELQREKSLSWDDLLAKYLTAEETQELKKDQKLDAEKIAAMFLSPVENAPATNTTPEKPAATTTTPPLIS